jgi:GNAT superfamily N-acetyltransferase
MGEEEPILALALDFRNRNPMPDAVTIRPATEADAAAIAGLITELGSPTTPAEMAARLATIRPRADFVALVAVTDGAVAGMAGLSVSPSFVRNTPNGQIVAMVVGAGYQRRGIGRALIDAAEAWFRERGATRIMLVSGLHRAGAHAFYRACGFEHTGLRFVQGLK